MQKAILRILMDDFEKSDLEKIESKKIKL